MVPYVCLTSANRSHGIREATNPVRVHRWLNLEPAKSLLFFVDDCMETSVWCCKEVDEGYESEFWHSCKGHFYEGAHKTAGQDGQENSGIPGKEEERPKLQAHVVPYGCYSWMMRKPGPLSPGLEAVIQH